MTTNSVSNRFLSNDSSQSLSNPVQANPAPQEREAGCEIAGGVNQGPPQTTTQASYNNANAPASAPITTAQRQTARMIMRPSTAASSGTTTTTSPGVTPVGLNAATVASSQPSTVSSPRPATAANAPAPLAPSQPALRGMASAGEVSGLFGTAAGQPVPAFSGGPDAASSAHSLFPTSHASCTSPIPRGTPAALSLQLQAQQMQMQRMQPWASAGRPSPVPVSAAPASTSAPVDLPTTHAGGPGTLQAAGPDTALSSSSVNIWLRNRVAPACMTPQIAHIALQRVAALEEKAKMAEARLSAAELQLAQDAQTRSELVTENNELHAEIGKVRAEAETEIARVRSKAEAQIAEVHATADARLKTTDEAVRAAEGRAADAEGRVLDAESRAADAEKTAASAEEKLVTVETKLADAEGAADQVLDLMDEVGKYKADVRKLEAKLGEREQRVQGLEEKVKSLEEQVKELEDQDAALSPRARKKVRMLWTS